jgi:hypothetical protein
VRIRDRRAVVVAMAWSIAVVVPVAGCGIMDGASSGSVDWMNRTCGVVAVMVTKDPVKDEPPSGEDTAAVRASMIDYLDKEIQFVEARLAEINGLGKAPMDGGDDVANVLRTKITEIRDGFRAAKQRIETADVNDEQAFVTGQDQAIEELKKVADKAEQAGKEINSTAKAHKSVDVSWNLADNCKALSDPTK